MIESCPLCGTCVDVLTDVDPAHVRVVCAKDGALTLDMRPPTREDVWALAAHVNARRL